MRTSTGTRCGSEKIQKLPPAKLTGEQRKVLDGIIQEWEGKSRPCLIHGVTGSGKTEVYMELIDRTLKQGKQAIILIPEIALTYQTVMRFYGRFGEVMSVLHSRLSQGERYDQSVGRRRERFRSWWGRDRPCLHRFQSWD